MTISGRTGHWDHKTKPSTFVVTDRGKEIFRGNFSEGYKLLNNSRSFKDEVAKYFDNPPCQVLRKTEVKCNPNG